METSIPPTVKTVGFLDVIIMIHQVVILAGGKGTRLGSNKAKCLMQVNELPILQHIINEFKKQNVNKIHLCLGFDNENVLEWLNNEEIEYTFSLDDEENLGTWKALVKAKEYLDDTFFVTYGDSIAFCDLFFMQMQYIESKQKSMTSVSNYQSNHANLFINDKNEIDIGVANFVEHGISIFSKSEINDDLSFKNFSDFFKGQKTKVHYACANYYQINTPEDLHYANLCFKNFANKNKYNFLDRDGTINIFMKDIYESMNFIPNEDILARVDENNCVIVTNQPAKAKTETSLENINKMNFLAREFLLKNKKNVIFTQTCLHRDYVKQNDEFDILRHDCDCRKPKTGMLKKSLHRINIDQSSMFFGDSECDELCAEEFGLNFCKI